VSGSSSEDKKKLANGEGGQATEPAPRPHAKTKSKRAGGTGTGPVLSKKEERKLRKALERARAAREARGGEDGQTANAEEGGNPGLSQADSGVIADMGAMTI
jgi:hypothetical protein